MAFIKINSILKKRGQNEVRIIPAAVNGARIKVLVGSCAHCAKLRDNVVAAMKQANIPETELETISDLVKITRMGIITTPALIVDGKLLCCGKVLSVEELLPLLKQNRKRNSFISITFGNSRRLPCRRLKILFPHLVI